MRLLRTFLLFTLIIACQRESKVIGFASTDSFQLARPIIHTDSSLFKNSTTIALNFNLPGTELRYTTNGQEVTRDAPKYGKPIFLDYSTTVKAKVFHSEYLPSLESSIQVVKIKNNISGSTIEIAPKPHPNYSGNGPNSLIDLQKGTLEFRNGNKWLGFQSDVITIDLQLDKERIVSKVNISTLIDQNAWIFSPKKISVFSQDKEVGSLFLDDPHHKKIPYLRYMGVPILKNTYKHLKILVYSLEKIPDWHQGKDTQPWMFLDEILIE